MIKLKKLNFNFPSFSTEFDVETSKNEIFGVIGRVVLENQLYLILFLVS